MNRFARIAAVIGFALATSLVVACGGTGGLGGPATLPGSTIAGDYAQRHHVKRVRFRIDAPAKRRRVRRGHYLSPATQSVSIQIETTALPSPSPVASASVNLTPTSPQCNNTLSGVVCGVEISVPAYGQYSATIEAWDGQSAQGTVLSVNQTNIDVEPTMSPVPLVLNGVVYSMNVSSNSPAVHGNAYGSYTLYESLQSGSFPFTFTPLDPDGNIIFGPGAPTITGSIVPNSSWGVEYPNGSSPPPGANVLDVLTPDTNGAGAVLTATETNNDGGEFVCYAGGCTTTIALKDVAQTLFVANSTENDGGSLSVLPAPYATDYPSSLSIPTYTTAMLLDPLGNLFIANGNGSVVQYEPPFTNPSPDVTINGFYYPQSLARDKSGDLFVLDTEAQTVDVCAAPYSSCTDPVDNFNCQGSYYICTSPQSMAIDSKGDLFVGSTGDSVLCPSAASPPPTDCVQEYLAGTFNNDNAQVNISSGISAPTEMVFDPAGDLWVANCETCNTSSGTNSIEEFVPPFSSSSTPLITLWGVPQPYFMQFDKSGDLFVVNQSEATVSEYKPPYNSAPITIGSGTLSLPESVVIDGAGNLLVVDNAGYVYAYAPPYTGYTAAVLNTVNAGLTSPLAAIIGNPQILTCGARRAARHHAGKIRPRC